MGVVEGATEVLTVMEVLMGVAAAEVAMEVHLVAAVTHMDHLEAEAMVAAATAVDHLVAAVAMATAAAVEAMEAAAVVVAEAMVTAAAAVAMEAAVEVAAAEASVAAAAAVVEEAAMVKTKSSLTTKSMPLAPQPTSQKKILPPFFGSIGVIKNDKRTGKPKIWIYKNRDTGEQKGEATVTYDDPAAAESSISWFDGKDFNGHTIKVQMA